MKFKTKFDSLVKLKKLKIDEVQKEISKLNTKISKIQDEIKLLQEEINNFSYPSKGNFSLITQFKMMQSALFRELTQKEENIKFLENQKNSLFERLKDVNLEYEKMKYLQAEEIKKEIQKLKEKEIKNMDEIALLLWKG